MRFQFQWRNLCSNKRTHTHSDSEVAANFLRQRKRPQLMALPRNPTFPLSLLLLLVFLLSATSAQQQQEEEFTEELLMKPLPDRKVLAHFHFQSEAPLAADESSFARHHHLFPKSISQLVRAFFYSFSVIL